MRLVGLSLVLLFLFATITGNAQSKCDFQHPHKDPITPVISQASSSRSGMITIPVVFHVVLSVHTSRSISDEQILLQLDQLNRDFGGEVDADLVPAVFEDAVSRAVAIQFCLGSGESIIRKRVTIDDIGISEAIFYDDLGGNNAVNPERYLNIWIADTGGNIAGYASYPEQVALERQGVVVHPEFFQGGSFASSPYRTLTHEVGHYLGLLHPWGSGGCNSEDFVDDTPLQAGPYSNRSPESPESCGSSDMYMTFMDYTDDACTAFFTNQQVSRMVSVIEEFRPGLLQHEGDECKAILTASDLADLKIYPVPTSSMVFIEVNSSVAIFDSYAIYDATGRQVAFKSGLLDFPLAIDISHFPSGIYFLRIGGKTRKIVRN